MPSIVEERRRTATVTPGMMEACLAKLRRTAMPSSPAPRTRIVDGTIIE
jgi:hypothetical protein